MLEYLQMWPDTFAAVKRYPPEDRCLLYEAMGRYAFTGEEPDWPEDNTKWLIWEALKQRVDTAALYAEKQRTNGNKGGRPRNPTKPNVTQRNPEKPTETQPNPTEPNKTSESESESESDTESESEKKTKRRAREEEPEGFSRFWAAYPRHTDRKGALRAFQRISPDEPLLGAMLEAIRKQKQSDQWTRDGGAYIPHPSTWLNQERWNDELPKSTPRQKTVVAQQYDQRDYSADPPEDPPDWMTRMWEEKQKEGSA